MSDFVRKKSQRVIIWITSFKTCLVLSKNDHNLSNFDSETLKSVRFCFMKFKKSQILSWKLQKVTSAGKYFFQKFTWILLFSKMDIFCPFVTFKGMILKKICLHRVEFLMEKIATCQFLDQNLYNVSNLELKT